MVLKSCFIHFNLNVEKGDVKMALKAVKEEVSHQVVQLGDAIDERTGFVGIP